MKKLIGLTVLTLTFALISPPQTAEAHGRNGGKIGIKAHFGFGHFAPVGYFGYGRGYYHRGFYHRGYPYRGYYHRRPYYRGYRGYHGPAPVYRYGGGGALGRVDVDVEPKDADVYINGSFVGKAGKLDGWPDYLWLQQGIYDLSLVHPEHRTITREIAVYPRLRIDLDLTMEPGPSTPPPTRESAEKPPEEPAEP